jgi:hypothetical protein
MPEESQERHTSLRPMPLGRPRRHIKELEAELEVVKGADLSVPQPAKPYATSGWSWDRGVVGRKPIEIGIP